MNDVRAEVESWAEQICPEINRLRDARDSVRDAQVKLADAVRQAHESGLLTSKQIAAGTGLSIVRVEELRPGRWGDEDVPF